MLLQDFTYFLFLKGKGWIVHEDDIFVDKEDFGLGIFMFIYKFLKCILIHLFIICLFIYLFKFYYICYWLSCLFVSIYYQKIIHWFIYTFIYNKYVCTGWPIKIRNSILPSSHNMWMQLLVSVYEVTSPEKNDTKISNFGSVIYFLGHILWDNVEAQHFPFSA